ncbi:MAG: tetratricopeptide repeat protein [Salinivirgaceae bacterium]|nr:tetratricopeptide repeat protein [Salinivirgaceae bacterium]
MNLRVIFILFFILIISGQATTAQKVVRDSLLIELNKSNSDTSTIDLLNELSTNLIRSYPDSALVFVKKSEALSKKINDSKRLAESCKLLGNIFYGKDDFDKAENFYQEALNEYIKTNNILGKAKIYNNLGALYRNKGNYTESLKYYQLSLEFREQIGDRQGMGKTYNNIGNLHLIQKNFNIALKYFNKSQQIRKEYNDSLGISGCYVNIGATYIGKNNYTVAISYFKKAIEIYQSFEDIFGMGECYKSIGIANLKLEKIDLALDYLAMSYEIEKKLGDRIGMASSLTLMANTYNKSGEYKLALQKALKSLEIANKLEVLQLKTENYEQISLAYEGLANYNKSLYYHKLLLKSKDSLINIEKIGELEAIEAKYQSENKQLQIEKLESDNKLNSLNMQRMQIKQYFSYGIIAISLLIIITLFLLRIKLQRKNRTIFDQNEEIRTQNEELEKHRNHLEDLVEKRTADLVVAKEKAEKSDQLKSAFLANMSHEIRTPLNAIVGFSNLISEGELTKEENLEYSKFVENNSNALINLIDDIIDIAKIESGNFAISKVQTDVFLLTKEIFNSYKSHLLMEHKENIEFILNTDKTYLLRRIFFCYI